jgi:hypothetical protein
MACAADPGHATDDPVPRIRSGLIRIIDFMDDQPALFPTSSPQADRVLPAKQRAEILRTWAAFGDNLAMLDTLQAERQVAWAADGMKAGQELQELRAAFLAQYRFALEFLSRAERDSTLDLVLNEAAPELGIQAGAYDRLELRFLNVAAATRFSALEAFGAASQPPTELAAGIEEDRKAIWKMGSGRGPLLTLKNATEVMGQLALRAWLPVQTEVADFMGDTKVWRPGRSLISGEQLRALRPRLLPGDVMLTRRDWYLSNVGLPGYWTHAALYIGDAQERTAAFGEDAPQPAVPMPRLEDDEPEPLVIEAIGEGVLFTSIEHAGDSDALVVLRPRLTAAAKRRALDRAFAFAGRPYDFNFDFRTDNEIVCTELVYKAYRSDPQIQGLQLPLVSVVGRPALPANEIARRFAEEDGEPYPQFDFVAFIDGDEHEGNAVESTRAAFIESSKRPNWHVVTRTLSDTLRSESTGSAAR